VWRLSSPLTAGGRNSYERVEERYGGGGFYTGTALIALKHHVRLMATLADDAKGRLFRGDLARAGFDVTKIRMVPGETIPVEVMVDPLGERTIISSASVEHAVIHDFALDGVDVVYVNARRVDPRPMQAAMERCLVVAQAPLESEQRRPCHFLVASHSDEKASQIADPLAYAQSVAGDGLMAYIVTNGALPTRIYSAAGEAILPACAITGIEDSSGAGDVFCAGLIDALVGERSVTEAVQAASAHAARFLKDRGRLFGSA
jgi:sugar/nucleoside kinase (ribokinase family)